MKSSNLMRLGGLAALLGGVLLAIRGVLRLLDIGDPVGYPISANATTWSFTLLSGVGLLGTALFLVGLVGLYAAQSKSAGVLGLVSFVILLITGALGLANTWFQLFILPDIAVAAPEWVDATTTEWATFGFSLGSFFGVVGWSLFAVAMLRARIYPTMAVVVLILGLMVTALSLPDPLGWAGSVIRYAAVAWLGFALLTGRVGSREEPLPALNLVRWGALAAILAGVVWIASGVVRAFDAPASYVDAVTGLALVCTLGGLLGLHVLQEMHYGRLGQVGFYATFVGIALIVANRIPPSFEAVYVLASLGLLVGTVLLGIATSRAKMLPLWCGLLLVSSLPLSFIAEALAFSLSFIADALAIYSVPDIGRGIGLVLTLGILSLALGYALLVGRKEGAAEVGTPQQSIGAKSVVSSGEVTR